LLLLQGMKYIKLADGHRTKVDNNDYVSLSQYKWHLSNGYPSRHKNDGSGSKIYMHRVINKTPDGLHVDHINHDKLDNRKNNLRNVTASQNHMNRKKVIRSNTTSTLKGASYHAESGRWRARIYTGEGEKSLGYFKTDREAHLAYRKAVKLFFGVNGFVG